MNAPPPPAPVPRPAAPLAALFCLVLAAAAHASAVRNDWVLDDVPVVRDGPALARGGSGLAALFRAPAEAWPGDLEEGPARPLALATLALERRVWDALGVPLAQGFHATHVLLHALASVLLLTLLARALPGRGAFAVGTALVFAVHPLATGVVSSATGRADVLAVLFGLLALHAWLRYAPGRATTVPLCALALFLALLSKEAAVGIPLAMLVLDRSVHGLSPVKAVRARWPGYLALAGTLALWLVLWPGPGRPGADVPEPGVGARLLLGLEALGRQALAVLVPVGLLPDRTVEAVAGSGYPLRGGALFTALLSGVALLLAALWPARSAAGRALRAVVGVAGALALAQALTLPVGAGLEDRAAYLLLPALAGLGGLALEALVTARAGRVPAAGLGAAAAALVALFALTAREAAAWRSEETLQARLLERLPTHGPAMLRRAQRLAQEAERHRALASAIRADDRERLEEQRRLSVEARAGAMEAATEVARLASMRDDPEVHLLLGTLQLDDGRPAEAEHHLRRARELEPVLRSGAAPAAAGAAEGRGFARAARIYAALGRTYTAQGGRVELAADAWEQAVRWDRRAARALERGPDPALAYSAAMALLTAGRFADGLPLLAEVASTAPDPVLRNQAAADHQRLQREGVGRLREVLAEARRLDAARTHDRTAMELYEQALAIDPRNVEARERAAYIKGKIFGLYPAAKDVVREGLALLDGVPAAESAQDRDRLSRLLADLERWDRESAEEEAREMEQPPKERKVPREPKEPK